MAAWDSKSNPSEPNDKRSNKTGRRSNGCAVSDVRAGKIIARLHGGRLPLVSRGLGECGVFGQVRIDLLISRNSLVIVLGLLYLNFNV